MDLPALLCSVLLSSRPVMLHTYPSFPFLLSAASATSFSAPLCTTTHHFAHLCTTFHPFPPLSTTLHPFTLLCIPLHPFALLCTPLHCFAPLFHHFAPAPHISYLQDGRTLHTSCHHCFVHTLEHHAARLQHCLHL